MADQDEDKAVTAAYLADLCSVSEGTIYQWRKKQIVIPAGRGRYDLRASIKNILAHYRDRQAEGGGNDADKLREQKARADKLELQVGAMRRDYVSVADVDDFIFSWTRHIRDRAERVPDAVIRDLKIKAADAVKIKSGITRKIHEALMSMATDPIERLRKADDEADSGNGAAGNHSA